MRKIILLSVLATCFFSINNLQAQAKKIDTTAYFGDAGYHVSCNNKKEKDNVVSIDPKGFKNTARNIGIPITGRVTQIIVDDLNDDGFPDLLLCIFSGQNDEIGGLYGISSVDNSSLVPVSFPDIYSDPKNREGYKGHDEFKCSVGSLFRSFPIYKATDTDKPTGGVRVMQYKITPAPAPSEARVFKLLRSYEK